MATNVFFSPAVRTEQNLYEDLVIESVKFYGQDVYYIPRELITSDEILNEEYSRFSNSYVVEMYITNTDGFDGEGRILSKFGLQIRDQLTLIVAKRRFHQLVNIDENDISHERPREGDLIFLPLSNSLFEIRYVDQEKPFYQLSNITVYQIHCELFEYNSEQMETGIRSIDRLEEKYASKIVVEITGGSKGFAPGDKIKQIVLTDTSPVEIYGEVSLFDDRATTMVDIHTRPRVVNLHIHQVRASNGSGTTFSENGSNIFRIERNETIDSEWHISKVFNIGDVGLGIPNDSNAQNDRFQSDGNDIIDWSESNPFGEPRVF
jgi:hypothetical protein